VGNITRYSSENRDPPQQIGVGPCLGRTTIDYDGVSIKICLSGVNNWLRAKRRHGGLERGDISSDGGLGERVLYGLWLLIVGSRQAMGSKAKGNRSMSSFVAHKRPFLTCPTEPANGGKDNRT